MRGIYRWTMAIVVLASVGMVCSADKADEPKPTMTQLGKSLLTDDLNAAPAKEWKMAKGKWEVVDNAWRGKELASDMHGAVARHNVAFTDGVVQFSFKLDGAEVISLSINGAKGHICRVRITPKFFVVSKDDGDGKAGPDTAKELDKVEMDFTQGTWYTVTLEMCGSEILAKIGDKVAYGKHDAIAAPKTNIGLTVAGESAFFKNVRVHEATLAKDWEQTKAKLGKK